MTDSASMYFTMLALMLAISFFIWTATHTKGKGERILRWALIFLAVFFTMAAVSTIVQHEVDKAIVLQEGNP